MRTVAPAKADRGVTYYHIWACKSIRAVQADDLIWRWLLPTFWLELWSIIKIKTECVNTHRKLGLHRSWRCLICLPVTYRYWSPAPRVESFILHNIFTKQHTSYKITVTNPDPYTFAQSQHSNEAAMKTNGTVATVLASKCGVWSIFLFKCWLTW